MRFINTESRFASCVYLVCYIVPFFLIMINYYLKMDNYFFSDGNNIFSARAEASVSKGNANQEHMGVIMHRLSTHPKVISVRFVSKRSEFV